MSKMLALSALVAGLVLPTAAQAQSVADSATGEVAADVFNPVACGFALPEKKVKRPPPRPEPVRRDVEAEEERAGQRLLVSRPRLPSYSSLEVRFARGSDQLDANSQSQVDQLFAALKRESPGQRKFLISGHTMLAGSEKLNEELSLRRANAVIALLVERGFDRSALVAGAFGGAKPVTGQDFNAAVNRRVQAEMID